jgi:bifunctional non-homologous end joining protein LigD
MSLATGFVPLCIPTRAYKVPSGSGWVHEIKHDGYRLQMRREGEAVRLFTRRGYDWSARYPAIAATAAKLRAISFTIDGEAVVCGPDGVAVFDALHRRGTVSEAMLYAFDLLELDGEGRSWASASAAALSTDGSLTARSETSDTSLRGLPLSDRKKRLARLVGKRRLGIVLSDHTGEDGTVLFQQACKLGLEGIVSKKLSAPYRSGRSTEWLKIKNPNSPAMVRHREGDW